MGIRCTGGQERRVPRAEEGEVQLPHRAHCEAVQIDKSTMCAFEEFFDVSHVGEGACPGRGEQRGGCNDITRPTDLRQSQHFEHEALLLCGALHHE